MPAVGRRSGRAVSDPRSAISDHAHIRATAKPLVRTAQRVPHHATPTASPPTGNAQLSGLVGILTPFRAALVRARTPMAMPDQFA